MLTTLNEKQIRDGVLTGASFRDELGFYNETANYTTGARTYWKGRWYEATTDITGTTEGDLSAAPDVSANWVEVKTLKWSAYPSASQTFNNVPVVMILDTERASNPSISLDTATGEITINSAGEYQLTAEYSAINTTGTRVTSKAYFEVSTDGGATWSIVSHTEIWSYNREATYGQSTGAITIPITANVGDKYRVTMVSSSATNVTNIPEGCNVSIFDFTGAQGEKGDKGDKGDTGAPGDIIWTGPYNSGITYQVNEVMNASTVEELEDVDLSLP